MEVEKRKRKVESRIDVDDEISLKVPIKQSRLFKTEMKVRKPRLKENIKKIKQLPKEKKTTSIESKGVSTRSSSRQHSETSLSSVNVFLSQKLKKLKKLKQEKKEIKRRNVSKMISRNKDRDFKKKVIDDTTINEDDEKGQRKKDDHVVRKKGRQPGELMFDNEYIYTSK